MCFCPVTELCSSPRVLSVISVSKLPVNFRINPHNKLVHSCSSSQLNTHQKWPPFNSASTSAPPLLSRPYIFSVHGTTTLVNFLLLTTSPLASLVRGREHSDSRALLSKLVNDTGTTTSLMGTMSLMTLPRHPPPSPQLAVF